MSSKHEQQLRKQGFVSVSNAPLAWPRRRAFQNLVDAGKAKAVQYPNHTLYIWLPE